MHSNDDLETLDARRTALLAKDVGAMDTTQRKEHHDALGHVGRLIAAKERNRVEAANCILKRPMPEPSRTPFHDVPRG